MKHYAIYQYWVPPGQDIGKELLVGKVRAISEEASINNYLAKEYPDDESKREFVRGYLMALECSVQSFKKDDSEKIKNNKRDLGVWA